MQGNINIPDSTITTNLSFRQLVLMNMQQLTNFPYIEKDFDALTDYELLCLVVKFLNDVIANQNEQNASITRMYESFLALQDYVNNTKDSLEDAFNNLDDYVRNYFDNLDVQEEINNKLDKMLEDGVLEQIIEQFIQSTALWCFDTVADMKQATNLINGSYAKTLGYYAVNDGGGAEYKIVNDETLVDDGGSVHALTNGLRAKLISDSTVNIKQYGAHGDGLTNDTEAFSKAIAKYNQIYIPSGQYLITEEISLNKSVTLYGEGSDPGRSAYQYKSEILSTNNYAFACEWGKSCIFRDLAFNGYGLNMPIGIVESCSFTGTLGIYYLRGRVDKCYFNANTGIQKAVDSVITDCTFAGCDIALDFTDSNDNRVVNNRIDWNELGLKMREAMYNIITNNIFDRQTTYAIDIDTSPYNIISNNNFERNLSAHIYGKMSYENITNNRFVMKRITDDSSSNELQPTTAFKVDSIGHTVFSSNYIYADKFFNARPLFSTMVFSGNSFNGNDMEEPLLDLGTITVANGQTGNFYALWDNVKYFNIYGSRIELTNIIITNNVNATVYYSGDSHITRLDQVPTTGIHVNILNDLGEQATYTIKARVKIKEPWLMEMPSE